MPQFAQASGMGQLTSPPVSARDFATWFLSEFSHPTLSEKSLDLLISDASASTFSYQGVSIPVERATMANVEPAILRWFDRGDLDEDSLLVFYFCGHGLGRGKGTTLLLEDFGSRPFTNSLKLALDFDALLLGMDQCKARSQCFFVDACRVGTAVTLFSNNFYGEQVVVPSTNTVNRSRSAPVYYSAVPGTQAYGDPNRPSFFTSALIKAFKGAGADDHSGAWRVDSDVLHRGIRAHLKRAVANTSAQSQIIVTDGLADPIPLHVLPGNPLVPVDVSCDPSSHNAVASLNVKLVNGAPRQFPAVPKGEWQLELEPGTYDFGVTFPPPPRPNLTSVTHPVRPPSKRVDVPVP